MPCGRCQGRRVWSCRVGGVREEWCDHAVWEVSGKKGVVMQGGRCQGSRVWPPSHFMSFMSVHYVCMLFCQSTYAVAAVIPIANYNYLE